MRKRIIYLAILSTLIGCDADKKIVKEFNVFEKPIENVDVLIQKLSLIAEQGDTLYLDNETKIIIPANAFVDKKGIAIRGAVELSFQEYHTDAEVILSGIPMKYDSAGISFSLETDGMFKISGKQKEETIEIAPNKSLKVFTKSYKEDTPCFNYYTQNEHGKWNYKETAERVLNPENEISKELSKVKKMDKEAVAIDFYINTFKYPELSQFKNISWMYNGDKPDTLRLKLMAKIKWNEFQLVKTAESMYSYLLIGMHKKHHFSMPITPAFSDDELTLVKELITKKIKEDAVAYDKLKSQYQREASIIHFGTHNWDRCAPGGRIIVETSLFHEEKIKYFYVLNYNSDYRFVNRYIINEEVDRNKVSFLTRGNAGIIAFLETEGKVAYWSGNVNQKEVSLNLESYPSSIETPADLQELINQM